MNIHDIEIVNIPAYPDYRYDVIFQAYKWDPQVSDVNTISPHAVLLDAMTAKKLEQWAELLYEETVRMEEALLRNLSLATQLGLPTRILKALARMRGYDRARHVRLMRFDFHPTIGGGWAVSEVNSDVPGGLAEASILPGIAKRYLSDMTRTVGNRGKDGHMDPPLQGTDSQSGDYCQLSTVNCQLNTDTTGILLEAFLSKLKPGGRVAFVHATSYADDRQVMQCLNDRFRGGGLDTLFAAPDHIAWRDGRAISLLDGCEGELDGIARFFPLEWLLNLPRRTKWEGFFENHTLACNHPVAILTQSKRLPLVWDKLGIDAPTWKSLLPETADPKNAVLPSHDWLLKPALGRVGEDIAFSGITPEKERRSIEKAARKQPKDWIIQRKFESRPLVTPDGQPRHLCVGVFAIDGKAAGFYGRASKLALIDARAEDIPILVVSG